MSTTRTLFFLLHKEEPQILIILTWAMALSHLSFYYAQLSRSTEDHIQRPASFQDVNWTILSMRDYEANKVSYIKR